MTSSDFFYYQNVQLHLLSQDKTPLTGLGKNEHAALRAETQEMTKAEHNCPVSSNSDLTFSCFLIISYPTNTLFSQAQEHLRKASENSSESTSDDWHQQGWRFIHTQGLQWQKPLSFQYLHF